MKRHPLFFALAVAMGLAVAGPTLAAPQSKQSEVKAMHALIDKQQQQLDEQQKELQTLRDALQRLEGNQQQQQAQIAAQAKAPPAAPVKPVFTSGKGLTVALNGFVSASAFSQDKAFVFGNGQNAE